MQNLGPGLNAVGCDQMLKTMGKDSGLLYGPSADGGAMSVSMGHSNDNGHANHIVDWGAPTLDGFEISSDDVARCRMNLAERTATAFAWNNDRVQDFPINTAAMGRGIDGILEKLRDARQGDNPNVKRPLDLQAAALTARLRTEGKSHSEIKAEIEKQKPAFENRAETDAWANRSSDERRAINSWRDISKDSDYTDSIDLVRKAAGEMSDVLKSGMLLKKTDGLNKERCLIRPSNTEHDNRVSDNEQDRDSVGGGQIGSQKYGSANATDAVYCVPLNGFASSINGTSTDDPDDPESKKCSATAYNDAPDNGAGVPDQFVILTSMPTMLNKSARGY